MASKDFECPKCYGNYHNETVQKRSMICHSCPCREKCVKLSKERGGNTTLLSAAPSIGPSAAQNNAEQEWQSMWQSMISTLSQDPNLQDIVRWLEAYKKQTLGR